MLIDAKYLKYIICSYTDCGEWCPFFQERKCVASKVDDFDVPSIFIHFYHNTPRFQEVLAKHNFDWEEYKRFIRDNYAVTME